MDYRYLKVFIEAARSLNFAATAQKLSIAPSAVSRQIQLFEDSVGGSLFIRNNRKVVLTEKGREILKLVSPLEAWGGKESRTLLRVAGLGAAIDNYFWPRLDVDDLKDFDLEIYESVSSEALRMLEQGQVEMAYVNKKVESSLVSYFNLGSENFCVISKNKIYIDQLAEQRWIYGESGDLLKQVSGSKKEHPYIKANSIFQIYELVEQGFGIAIVPVSKQLKKRKFHTLDLPLKTKQLYLALPNYEKIPKALSKIYKSLT